MKRDLADIYRRFTVLFLPFLSSLFSMYTCSTKSINNYLKMQEQLYKARHVERMEQEVEGKWVQNLGLETMLLTFNLIHLGREEKAFLRLQEVTRLFWSFCAILGVPSAR
jgi:hypothetical protein